MLEHVVERLLHHRQHVMLHLGRERPWRNVLHALDRAYDGGVAEKPLGKLRHERREPVPAVVLRAHRPDNAFQFARQTARAPSQLAQRVFELGGSGVAVQPVGQHADLRDAAAEFVVEVTRDAGALLLKCMLPFQLMQVCLESSMRPVAREPYHQARERKHGPAAKPPRLPPGRRDDERKRRAFFVPTPVLIGGDHLQRIISRGQLHITRRAFGAGLDPVLIEPDQSVPEAHLFRRRVI